jgi:hypothetical protein
MIWILCALLAGFLDFLSRRELHERATLPDHGGSAFEQVVVITS